MIALEQEKIYQGTLLLVNRKYPVRGKETADLAPADLCIPGILMRRDAANVLQFILQKIAAQDAIVPVSGYRSQEEQAAIYDASLRENGEEFTKKYVALPDHSEHQTGLAVDLGLKKEEIDFIRPDFPYEGICEKFRRAAFEYGFIERYAKEKEAITGISHEPWHFRYVGYPHSKIMAENGLALEEYTEFIKNYREGRRLVYERVPRGKVEIYYVPACGERTWIDVPSTCVYQISGNNADGFIVTVWGRENGEK